MSDQDEPGAAPPRYGVIVSRFPKLTETFILQELRGLQARGLPIELFAIVHEAPEQLQPEAVDLDRRAHYLHFKDRSLWAAQWWWLRRAPRAYLSAWWMALSTSRGDRDALVRAAPTMVLAAAMARRMVELGVQRVHAHWATYPTLAALVIRRLSGLPFSFTCHAHDIFVQRSGLPAKMAAADLVLSCTSHGRDVITAQCGPDAGAKVRVVHHGVDLLRFTPTPLPDASGRPFRLLCVASLQAYKGHRHLLDAVALLRDRGVEVTLDLVGEGELRAEIEAQVAHLGLGDRVQLLGRCPSDEVRQRLRDADASVLASVQLEDGWMDGIPNVLVEAMASGRPVVSTRLAGIAELVHDDVNGLLARPGDALDLARAIERLVGDVELRRRLADAGRSTVERDHDAERNLDEVYRVLAGLPVP